MNKRYYSKEEYLRFIKTNKNEFICKEKWILVPYDICDGLGLLQNHMGPDRLVESTVYKSEYVSFYFVPKDYYYSFYKGPNSSYKKGLWIGLDIEEQLNIFDYREKPGFRIHHFTYR